jgi:hypothetical protein
MATYEVVIVRGVHQGKVRKAKSLRSALRMVDRLDREYGGSCAYWRRESVGEPTGNAGGPA